MQMNKKIFKSKFSLFSKNNAHKLVDTEISPKTAINQNAIWFQSMEPINYAKNQTKELYEINDTNIDEDDTKIFRNQLFIILIKKISNGS